MAGLCAAAALAKNFGKVTVLERDALPGPVPRRGVPQSHHTHALLGRGQEIMEQLFPGAFEALLEDGASVSDFGKDFRWYHHGSWRVRGRLGIDSWMVSRPLLESHLRDSLTARGNVVLRHECPVDAPIHDEAGGRVKGVRLRDGSVLEADLVVDALGRGSKSPKWLAEWGYGEVEEHRVEIGMTYVSGLFDVADAGYPDDGLMLYPQAPDNHRGGIALRVEGGRMMVTLFGYHGDRAPMDHAGFVEWSKTLPELQLHRLLARSRLIGELRQHTMPYQQRRGYAGMRMPAGYVVMGDALCSFDPSFGQGMTTAAMQAELLVQLRPGQRTARMQRRIARVTDVPWLLTSTDASCWPENHDEVSTGATVLQRYLKRVFELASHDLEVYRTLSEVMHFMNPVSHLFRPRVLWGVLFGQRNSGRRQMRSGPSELAVAPELSGVRRTGY
nr:tryptophan 7-halogenase [Enhygromyxa salina]